MSSADYVSRSMTTANEGFVRLAGPCAVLAGIMGFLYSVAFIIVARSVPGLGALLSAVFLTLAGLLSSVALIGLYLQVRETKADFALLGLVFGLAGAIGSALHGSYDLANAINPPDSNLLNLANLPSQVDPRGFLTFGVAGLGLIVFAGLIQRSEQLPKSLGTLAYVLAALLIIVYLGRLIVLDATSWLIVIPVVLVGFIVNPIWYTWLGVALLRAQRA
jgi:hypothetical protein